MLDRLAEIETKYEDLAEQINDPDVIANQTEWRKRMKEYSDITPIVEKYREYKQAKEGIAESLAMLEEKQEEDFRELLKEELAENKEKAERLKQELTLLLIPKDPNDEKNVIMEIRGGAGGDEAALFAGDLFRMYARYAERRKRKIEIMNTSESDLGGFKEISFKGRGCLFPSEIRKWRASSAACAGDGKRRTRAYLNGDGGSAAGGGGGRCAY